MTMMDDDFSSLAEHVMNKELYKDSSPVYDEGCSPETEVPFTLLHGESPTTFTLSGSGDSLFILTNYRLFASMEEGFYSVPLGLVEYSELRHPTDLLILCKDCSSLKLSFDSEVQSRSWMDRIHRAIKQKSNFSDVFAFIHFAYKRDALTSGGNRDPVANVGFSSQGASLLTSEYQRMGMGLSEMWRITECNTKYQICSSYPKLLTIPRAVTDKDLGEIAKFRSLGRVPAVVWRHRVNGCVLVRCSQPLVGVLGWRCPEDEKFFHALAQSCGTMPTTSNETGKSTPITNGHTQTAPSPLILDLRSYTAALGNRAKGGGCEYQDYYPDCEIRFKGLPNIHSVRKSFVNLRSFLHQNSLSLNFLSSLEGTQWLHYVSQLLSTAVEVVNTIHAKERPVVVHCSDGWDRTAQVVAIAELLLDPFYRTFKGFKVLVEREWLSFGHKFSDRCGLGADGEQSPIFVQWLDCVYQLTKQFPTAFEFNVSYLMKLAHYSYSLLCGTFLLNCEQQRDEQKVSKQTLSVWDLLPYEQLTNVLYNKSDPRNEVLFPSVYPKDLFLWQELYGSSHMIPYSSSLPLPLPHQSAQATPSKISPVNGNSWQAQTETNNEQSSLTTINSNSSSGSATINSNNATINSNNDLSNRISNGSTSVSLLDSQENVEEHSNGDSTGNEEDAATTVQSNVFHSFSIRETNGGSPHLPKDMEDSFRVVEDVTEPSLTVSAVKQLSNGTGLSLDGEDPSLTPLSISETNPWSSTVTATNNKPSFCKMDMSTFSECESRLRNIGEEDGMKSYQDPVQERVREIEEQYKERIARLEEKTKRLTAMLRHKINSSGSENKENGGDEDLLIDLVSDSSDNLDQPNSPMGNGWTRVDIEDTVGVQWIPDHAVTHCKQCGAEFWLGKRKHHCRNCGGVFCWKCSNYYCPVPREQLYGEQRVCGRCFDRLDGYLHSAKSHS